MPAVDYSYIKTKPMMAIAPRDQSQKKSKKRRKSSAKSMSLDSSRSKGSFRLKRRKQSEQPFTRVDDNSKYLKNVVALHNPGSVRTDSNYSMV